MIRLAALLVLLLGAFGVAPVSAHTRSESHSAWTIDGPFVRLSFSVADVEAARIMRDGGRPTDPAAARLSDAAARRDRGGGRRARWSRRHGC